MSTFRIGNGARDRKGCVAKGRLTPPRHDTDHARGHSCVGEGNTVLPAHLVFTVSSSSAVAAAAAPISGSAQQDRRGELYGEVFGMKELYRRQSERLCSLEVKPRRALPLGLDRLEQEV